MNILLLKGFNNYFNRTVKKYSTLADYKTNNPAYLEFANVNFNPNDGIATELVIGGPTQKDNDSPIAWEFDGSPDYLICYDTGDNETFIRSRWFVIEADRTRSGQYKLILRRDVIADNLDTVLSATTYIEKGEIPVGNNLLFNKEGMLFNQIKQQEEQLRDASNCAWLVAYISKGWANDDILINYNPAEQNFEDVSAANITAWLSQWGLQSGQPFLADPYDISYRFDWQAGPDFVYNYATDTYIHGNGSYS